MDTDTSIDSVSIHINTVVEDATASLDTLITKLGDLRDTLNEIVKASGQFTKLATNIQSAQASLTSPKSIGGRGGKSDVPNGYSNMSDQLEKVNAQVYDMDAQSLKKLTPNDLGEPAFARLAKTTRTANSEMKQYVLNSNNVLQVNKRMTSEGDKYKATLSELNTQYGKYGGIEEQLTKLKLNDMFDVDQSGVKVIGDGVRLIGSGYKDTNKELAKYKLQTGEIVDITKNLQNNMDQYKVSIKSAGKEFDDYLGGNLQEQLKALNIGDLSDSKYATKLDDKSWRNAIKSVDEYITKDNQLVTVTRNLQSAQEDAKVTVQGLGDTYQKSGNALDKFGGTLSMMLARIWIIHRALSMVTQGIGNAVKKAADYEESLNLFTTTMGDYADEAERWADNFSDKLYLDPSNVKEYMGTFNSLTKGLGVASDKAYLMSKNLTQLTYDLASFRNLDVETAFQKIQSGISGKIICLIRKGLRIVTNLIQWNSKHVMV